MNTKPINAENDQLPVLALASCYAPKARLSGLQKVCKIYGRMKCGDTMMAWDYANDAALPEAELRKDKARWAASERAKYSALHNVKDEPQARKNTL